MIKILIFLPLLISLSFCSNTSSSDTKEVKAYRSYLVSVKKYNAALKALILQKKLTLKLKSLIKKNHDNSIKALLKIKSMGENLETDRGSRDKISTLKENTVKALKESIALRDKASEIEGAGAFFEMLLLR
jgi:hypothetical protein